MDLELLIEKMVRKCLKEQGDNTVVYHGTDSQFNVFDDTKPIFFVDDINVAKTYGNKIFKAVLNINNPVVFDFYGKSTYFFYGKWYVPSELANKINEIRNDLLNNYSLDDELVDELSYHDFEDVYGDLDGIIMKNIKDANDGIFSNYGTATNYVVFTRNQIRVIK